MEKERRSSILKPQQPPNFDNGELSTTITATVKRRVSFHTVRTVQEFDVEHSKIIHSPHNEPMKSYDTTSSDGLTAEQVSVSESNGGHAAEIITNKLDRTVENFVPVTTSTPLLRLKSLNELNDYLTRGGEDTYNGTECCYPTPSHNIARREETNSAADHLSEKIIHNELDVLEVESMDMSDSSPSPVTPDATRKLFRRSTVLRNLTIGPNQQMSIDDETLASNATRLVFKADAGIRHQSEVTDEGLNIDAEKSPAIPSCAEAADMDISSGDGLICEIPIGAPSKQSSSDVANEPTNILFGNNNGIAKEATDILFGINNDVVNEPTGILFETTEKDTEASNRKDSSKSIVMVDDIHISNNIFFMESVVQQATVAGNPAAKSLQDANELSSRLDRQHISNEFLSSVRKAALDSPAVLPKKKTRLFSPEVILPPKTSISPFGTPKIDVAKDKADPTNTPENTASIDRSTDKVLTEIKHRLRRSLNQSGIFTLSELSAVDNDHISMLYDIPIPEPLFHPDDLRSQVSTAESFNNELHTTVEQSCLESSSLSSRRSEIVTAALGNESSFLTSRVDTMGFSISFRTIPCLRIKPNEQPQIMELKQLATTNLRKRIAEVVDRCKGLISTKLPNCKNKKIAECIKTLNPRKLSEKEARWFDVCYLMAQREWFVLRAKLAKLTSEKLDELLLETKAESEQQKRLAQSVKDYERSREEVMQRYIQLKSVDEAVGSAVQNSKKIEELRLAKRVGRLEVAQKELELRRKQSMRIEALLKDYHETKSAVAAQKAKAAARRADVLRKYNEELAKYRDLLAEKEQKD